MKNSYKVIDKEEIHENIRKDDDVYTFEVEALIEYVKKVRPDSLSHILDILDASDQRSHVRALKALLTVGFAAGRAYEAAQRPRCPTCN